ncbi:MAG: aminomethyl transferase family protein [Polyangiaceae bacterium]|nr:aminomethyl transferase family protein [Polyangiaceae bacterium]
MAEGTVPSPLRSSVALATPSSAYLRLEGDDVFEVVDRLVTTDLYLQEAQLRQSLILDDEGLIVADVIVGRDEDAYLLVIDGPSRQRSAELVAAHLEGTGTKATLLHESHDVCALHGPYAWELLGEWLGPDVIGLPYLSLFRASGALVLRTGRTGEYGYDILMPRDRCEALRADLERRGGTFDLGVASEEEVHLAALENGFFNVAREGQRVRDPLQLQLKWRLSKEKEYRGSGAVRARWEPGPSRRVVWLRSDAGLEIGDAIELEGVAIGEVVAAAYSTIRGYHLGIAAIDRSLSCAGIHGYQRVRAGERAPVVTLAPPVLNNLSLHVSPQRHSYRDRASFVFPSP